MPGSERRVVAWSTNVVHSGLANPSAAKKSNGRSRIYRNIAVWLGIPARLIRQRTCVYRNLNTGVIVMKSAQDGK
jgi:hypothetical protein